MENIFVRKESKVLDFFEIFFFLKLVNFLMDNFSRWKSLTFLTGRRQKGRDRVFGEIPKRKTGTNRDLSFDSEILIPIPEINESRKSNFLVFITSYCTRLMHHYCLTIMIQYYKTGSFSTVFELFSQINCCRSIWVIGIRWRPENRATMRSEEKDWRSLLGETPRNRRNGTGQGLTFNKE